MPEPPQGSASRPPSPSGPMPLLATLLDSGASTILLTFLTPAEVVAFSNSTSYFALVYTALTQLRADVSSGSAPYPIACDSLHECRGPSSRSRQQKWSLGGPLPLGFTYLSEAMRAFEVAEDDFLEGCACFGECEAPYDVDADDSSGSCPCVQLNAIVKSGSAPLFECHASCSCGPACRLRATQRRGEGGCKVPPTIRLRYMGAKGWGAYPTDAVPAGTFVADYTGEVLPVHEAKRRMLAYDRDGLNYVLTTQEFFQGGKQMCQTIVDATTCGNESRFFNHCCDPNLSVFVIRRGSFLRPHLAFFTKTRVEAGEELTYDYGATGSAGGTISQADEDQRNPEPQSIRKSPRACCRAEGHSPRRNRGLPRGHGTLQAQKKGCQWEAGGSGGLGGRRESGDHELSLRRPCLCGSRRCRGFLPYDRAIL